jgi:hypothetical protein
MSISDTTENSILAAIFNATTWANYLINATSSPEASIANALHTADPGDSGTMSTSEGTVYTSYARVNIVRTSGGWTVAAAPNGSVSPVANIDFPAASGGSATVTFWSTGKTGGGAAAILWSGSVSPAISVSSGVTPRLTTASTITLDNHWLATMFAVGFAAISSLAVLLS